MPMITQLDSHSTGWRLLHSTVNIWASKQIKINKKHSLYIDWIQDTIIPKMQAFYHLLKSPMGIPLVLKQRVNNSKYFILILNLKHVYPCAGFDWISKLAAKVAGHALSLWTLKVRLLFQHQLPFRISYIYTEYIYPVVVHYEDFKGPPSSAILKQLLIYHHILSSPTERSFRLLAGSAGEQVLIW